MTTKHRITVSLSPEECLALASLSVKSRASQAWIARQALVELLLARPVQSVAGQVSTKAVPGPFIRGRSR